MKVLVTGTTRNAGLAITRGLRQAGCRVIGVDDRGLPFNMRSRFLEAQYIISGPGDGLFVKALLHIVKKERPDVLLPVHRARAVTAGQEVFRGHTDFLLPAWEGFAAAYDNVTTYKICKSLGIPCPEIFSDREAEAVLRQNRRGRPPTALVVVKPRADFGGARGLSFVSCETSLADAKRRCETQLGEAFIAEYIPGGESMKTVNLLFDRRNRLAAYFTTQKLRQWPPGGGQTAMGVSTDEPRLVEMVLPFFDKMKWKGPAEVELKVDCRDQQPKVIEINPRFWGYIGFPIRCGLNFPYLLCRLAKSDETLPARPGYARGVKYINPAYYARAVWTELRTSRDKTALLRRLVAEMQGRKVTNYSMVRDWKVAAAKLAYELGRGGQHAESAPLQSFPL